MNFVGIDVGKHGGIAVVHEDGSIDTSVFDEATYKAMLAYIRNKDVLVVVEDVHAMPKQGVSSMFNFGYNKGWILGLLYAFGVPVQLVSPQKWKRMFGLDNDKKKSIECAMRLYPNANLYATPRCRKPHDGISEALLMAEWGKRQYNGSYKQC